MRNNQREEIKNNEEKMIIEYFNESDWFDKIKKKKSSQKKENKLKDREDSFNAKYFFDNKKILPDINQQNGNFNYKKNDIPNDLYENYYNINDINSKNYNVENEKNNYELNDGFIPPNIFKLYQKKNKSFNKRLFNINQMRNNNINFFPRKKTYNLHKSSINMIKINPSNELRRNYSLNLMEKPIRLRKSYFDEDERTIKLKMNTPLNNSIKLHKKNNILNQDFENINRFNLNKHHNIHSNICCRNVIQPYFLKKKQNESLQNNFNENNDNNNDNDNNNNNDNDNNNEYYIEESDVHLPFIYNIKKSPYYLKKLSKKNIGIEKSEKKNYDIGEINLN